MRRWLVATLLLVIGAPAVPVSRAAGGQSGSGGSSFAAPPPPSGFGIGEIVVTYTDPARRVFIAGHGSVPRQLVTVIRYPTSNPSLSDRLSAPPNRPAGGFPLVVFAHGYDITPRPYADLLRAWVRAGYVVVAPIFPLANPGAPGGPDESDLVNQPADMSFVITRILSAAGAGHGILSGLIDLHEIAVAGQSDGGSTALALAGNEHDADHRIDAAMILSGAMIPGLTGYDFPAPSPPLLAVQGTADQVNFPASTYRFFRRAPQPKFLLSLLGAGHLGPYTTEQPQLGIVERVTVAFLNDYLKHSPTAAAAMAQAGNVPRLARFGR